MKQKDIALIIIVVFISGMASFFVSKFVFKVDGLKENVETVEAISAEFPVSDEKFFNAQSINPTQIIKIDDNDYDLDTLPDTAKAQLQSLQFVDLELQRLQGQAAVLQTARVAYLKALQEALVNAPSLSAGDTIKLG